LVVVYFFIFLLNKDICGILCKPGPEHPFCKFEVLWRAAVFILKMHSSCPNKLASEKTAFFISAHSFGPNVLKGRKTFTDAQLLYLFCVLEWDVCSIGRLPEAGMVSIQVTI
jgi:hypothetical protein